jgi:hypothetical protein
LSCTCCPTWKFAGAVALLLAPVAPADAASLVGVCAEVLGVGAGVAVDGAGAGVV